MAQKIIINGTFDNDPSAEKIRTAFDKVNENFDELYAMGGSGVISIDTLGVAQDTITTTVSITTATATDLGYSQTGRNILIKNGANVINIECLGGQPRTYQKGVGSTGAITFVQGSGRTLVAVSGGLILNGAVGSIASLTSDGTTDLLIITNV